MNLIVSSVIDQAGFLLMGKNIECVRMLRKKFPARFFADLPDLIAFLSSGGIFRISF